MAIGAIGAGFESSPAVNNIADATNALEAMLFKELLKSMTDSIEDSGLMGNGFQSQFYNDMFSSIISQQASGGGVGISEMLQRSLGEEVKTGFSRFNVSDISRRREAQTVYGRISGSKEAPSNVHLKALMASFVPHGSESRWGREGELTSFDLAANISTVSKDNGAAVFNVNDAGGYKGHPKCNLFAFEMLRRADYSVPVTGRTRGWGYINSDAATSMAANGQTDGWAKVRTHEEAGQLDSAALSGVPILLSSSGSNGNPGHMAVADRIHTIQRDSDGNIRTVEYSGWEATTSGASYDRRVWRVSGVPGGGRGNLSRIEILEPTSSAGSNQFVKVGSLEPGASVLDLEGSKDQKSQGRVRYADSRI